MEYVLMILDSTKEELREDLYYEFDAYRSGWTLRSNIAKVAINEIKNRIKEVNRAIKILSNS